jgi:hypothetical protein
MPKTSKKVVPSWVVFVAAGCCFVAAADLPFGFYMVLRWLVCATAIALSYEFHRLNQNGWVWVIGLLAVLFNPFFRIYFDKDIWRVLDVFAGIILAISGRLVSNKLPAG